MEAGALGFMARAMVQATMPHRKVDGNEFERRNDAFTLSLMAPAKIGLPYGYAECPVHSAITLKRPAKSGLFPL